MCHQLFISQIRFIGFLLGLLCMAEVGWTQPDFRTGQPVDNLTIYQDYTNLSLYYYSPPGLSIATDAQGKPDVHFLQTRYTGTYLHDDQGAKRFRSLLQLTLIQQKPTAEQLNKVKAKLESQRDRVKLLPLPVQHLQLVLVYAVPNTAGDSAHTLPEGFAEAAKDRAEENWQERTYTVRLHEDAAQLFWEAFHRQQTILSIGYAFYAKGVGFDSLSQINLPDETPEPIKAQLSSAGSDTTISKQLVAADAFEVILDTQRWPELMQQIDINERVPPAFAALDIYCYDFNNQLRTDLYAKRVEILASGVAGGTVQQRVIFRYTEPEHYAETLHFPFAVRLDTPFQYRITEIFMDGHQQASDWITHASWYELLNITSATTTLSGDTDY